MSHLPDHWTPKRISTFSDEEVLQRAVRIATEEIEVLEAVKEAAVSRLRALSQAECKWVVRMYYVPETDWGAHDIGHMSYYGVSVFKYPVIEGKVQEGVVVEPTYRGDSSNEIHFYSDAMKKFKELCEKYKAYEPICANDVPDNKRGDYGDL